ncbi:MAG: ABC transporter substrate-binding protein [Mycobacteriales bacterium]
MHERPARVVCAAAVGLALLLAACTGGAPKTSRPLRGARLEVLATWSGAEQERFARVLDAFERSTGAVVTYTSASHRLPEVLDARLAAGRPPDVAFLPQPGVLRQEAAAGRLVPLDAATEQLVAAHFAPAFGRLASYRGRLYGVWFKAANKSLIWYDVATFERLGVVPPRDLPGLLSLAGRFAAVGVRAFAVAGRDAWTLSDWFENLYLRLAGPARYDALAAHRIPWTDPSVGQALRLMAQLLAPDHLAGGVAGALRTRFETSVEQVARRPARAAMVMEADFVAGVVTARTRAVLGADTDVFAFPAGPDHAAVVVGGGDVAVLLRRSVAGAALLRFLATPEAAVPWASAGGFVSPNLDLDLAVYPDEISRTVARRLLEAGDEFRFDLSDLQPAAFGGSDDVGLRAELRSFLVHRDVGRTCARLEAEARAAFASAP